MRAMQIAASSLTAQALNIDAIAHNLANVNTPGFKRSEVEFQDLLYAEVVAPSAEFSSGVTLGQGMRLSGVQRSFAEGQIQGTGNSHDFAISGGGFFRLLRGGKEFYTRDGSFRSDPEGQLVTVAGDPILGDKGPIVLPSGAQDVEVSANGVVTYIQPDPPGGSGVPTIKARKEAGRLTLAMFANPGGLQPIGENLWAATATSGVSSAQYPGENGAGRVFAGQLELSNVQAVEEMVRLMTAQRAYEMNSKILQSADEMAGVANNVFRG